MTFEKVSGGEGAPGSFPSYTGKRRKEEGVEEKVEEVSGHIGLGSGETASKIRVKKKITAPAGKPEEITLVQEAVTQVSKRKGRAQSVLPKKRIKEQAELPRGEKRGLEEVEGIPEEDLREISEKRRALPRTAETILEEVKSKLAPLRGQPDPIPTIEESILPLLDQLAQEDARYTFLQKDLHSLVSAMKGMEKTPRGLAPLLKKIYIEDPSQKGLTVVEARKLVADLLFLIDQHKDILKGRYSLMALDAEVECELMNMQGLFYFVSKGFGEKDVIKHFYPMTVAQLLLRPDGTLNLGFIDRIKSLVEKKTHPGFAREAYSVLDQLQADPTLCEKLRTFPVPRPGTVLDKAIHACLNLPYDAPITQLDVERACLAALLGWWRQADLGDCYCISFTQCVKDATLHWILDDLKEIGQKEVVTRQIGGELYEFPVLYRLARSRSKTPLYTALYTTFDKLETVVESSILKPICKSVGCTPGKEAEELANAVQAVRAEGQRSLFSAFEWLAKKNKIDPGKVMQIEIMLKADLTPLSLDDIESLLVRPYVKNACLLLGCTPGKEVEELSAAAKAVVSDGEWSLFSAFEWLAKKNGKSPNIVTDALQYVDATAEAPLLSLCKNAIGSMLFPPLTAPVISTWMRGMFCEKLISTFLKMAETANVEHCMKTLQSMQISAWLTEAEEKEIDEIWKSDPRASSSHVATVVALGRGLNALNSPRYKCLDRLVMAYAPPHTPESENPSFVLCEKTDKGIQPLTQERLGPLLIEMFCSFSEAEGETITQRMRSVLTKESSLFEKQLREGCAIKIDDKRNEFLLPCRIFGDEFLFQDPTPEEVYFGNSSPWERIELTRGEESVREVLKVGGAFQKIIGEYPGISLPAAGASHAFRFLPADPTMVSACKEPEKFLALYKTQGKELLERPVKEFPRLKGYVRNALEEMFPKIEMVEVSDTIPIRQAIQIWRERLQREAGSMPLTDKQEESFDLSILKALMAEDPSYRDPFLHFADLNWKMNVESVLRNKHLCFWYNPMKDTWKIVIAPEKGGAVRGAEESFEEKVSSIAIEAPGETHFWALKKKHLLTIKAKIRNKLLQIENAFVERSKYLERELTSLPSEKRKEALDLPLPALPLTLREALKRAREVSVKTPDTPQEALLLCRELQNLSRFIRQKAIEEIAPKVREGTLVEQGIELRKVRYGAYSTELFRLDDPESFKRWVMERSSPKEHPV